MILYHFETKKKFRKFLKIFHLDHQYTSLSNAGGPSRLPRPPGKESLTPIEHRKLIYFPFFINFRWFYIILRPKKKIRKILKIFHLDRPYTSLPNAGGPSRPPRPPGKESLTPIEHRKLIYFPFFITFRWFYIILRPKKKFEKFWKISNFLHFLNAPPFELRLSPLIL